MRQPFDRIGSSSYRLGLNGSADARGPSSVACCGVVDGLSLECDIGVGLGVDVGIVGVAGAIAHRESISV